MDDELLDDQMLAKEPDVAAVVITKDRAEFPFPTMGKEDLAGKIQNYLLKDGYKLESGAPTSGVYGKGSKTMRILFGAFVKRFTWSLSISGDEKSSKLVFKKDEKGYWGGAIGVAQVKTEWTRITNALKAYHDKHNS
ncbi:MAG: hypothetical protein BM555_03325 [Crocinitomix sp. MedPE-SWsnd]|nr:MAG: hypothetical protein BM555_03325 [Crocinitomix sp. MedPE-SWsnd]